MLSLFVRHEGNADGGLKLSEYDGMETAETVRVVGRVKWFDPAKGYGFIVPDDPALTELRDVLLHISSLRDSGRVFYGPTMQLRRSTLKIQVWR